MTPKELNQKRAELLALAMDKTVADEWVWACFPKAEPEYSYENGRYLFYVFPDGTTWVKVDRGETFFLSEKNCFNQEVGLDLYALISEQYGRQQLLDLAKERDRVAGWLDNMAKDLS